MNNLIEKEWIIQLNKKNVNKIFTLKEIRNDWLKYFHPILYKYKLLIFLTFEIYKRKIYKIPFILCFFFCCIFFRYGREDEEVMGLRFCNEAVMCLTQIWPSTELTEKISLTPLQVKNRKIIQAFRIGFWQEGKQRRIGKTQYTPIYVGIL